MVLQRKPCGGNLVTLWIDNMKRFFYTILILFLLVGSGGAATYHYYFSYSATGNAEGDDGNTCVGLADGAGDNSNACKTATRAQAVVNALGTNDIAYLYFDRGDTWTRDTFCSGSTPCKTNPWVLDIGASGPIVHINAYGSGEEAKPKFYGNVSDFSAVPSHDTSNGPLRWSTMLRIAKDGCTVKNIHIDGVYGHAIMLYSGSSYADNVIIESCDITNYGQRGITTSSDYATRNTTVTKNLIHTGGQLYKYEKVSYPSWGIAITLSPWTGSMRDPSGNIISHNVIYDHCGEGIHGHGFTAEYNLIGDTTSHAISVTVSNGDLQDTIVRYNLITFSDYASSTYDYAPSLPAYNGIVLDDGGSAGDNSGGTVDVYGNIIINRRVGLWFLGSFEGCAGGKWGGVKFYNNTIIDSSVKNICIGGYYDTVASGQGFIYNNASILYDRSGDRHAGDQNDPADLSTYWTIDNNAFWDATANDEGTVDSDWRTKYVTTNPKLYGEETTGLNWDGLGVGNPTQDTNGSEYAEFTDVIPESDSSLIVDDPGKDLGANYNSAILSTGTDFDDVLDGASAFVKRDMDVIGWKIGGAVPGFYISDPKPIGLMVCDNGSSTDTCECTSSSNADCKYSTLTEGDDCDTPYADLKNAFDTGDGGTAHTFNSTVNCNSSETYYVKCQDTDGNDSNCLTIIHSVAVGGGVTPQPAPGSKKSGGVKNVSSGGTMNWN